MDKKERIKKENIEYIIKNSDMFREEDKNRLTSHIEGHMYFLGKNLNINLTWDDAAFSWMENIYQPLAQVMETLPAQLSFPHRRKADLFFELCDHLYYMSIQRQKEVDVYEAVLDYSVRFGEPLGKFVAKVLSAHKAA